MPVVRDEYANAEAFLAARPAVRVIDLLLPDLCGVLRGKRVDKSDLAGIYQRGMFLPGSMFALDVLGGTIQTTGLGFDEGDADRACVPVPRTLVPSPWMGPSVAQLQVQMLDHDGGPFYGDPRQAAVAVEHDGPFDAGEALAAGLVTSAPDEIDWEDEVRLAVESRAALSPDALTGMEANLRFVGPETMETKIFGRLSAWQNWIFQRPNAVGPKGALTTYGSSERAEFDFKRT